MPFSIHQYFNGLLKLKNPNRQTIDSDYHGFTRKKSIETIEILLELIKQSLESGDDVLISGFVKLCVKKKKKRHGRNPATGVDLMLAPRKVVRFRSSRKLREKINAN